MLPSTFRRSLLAAPPHVSHYAIATRHFQTTSRQRLPEKQHKDRETINVDSHEYSKSGGDGKSAKATEQAAFDPQQTKPETEHETARQESGGESNNPLNVSPANQSVSKPRGEQEGGAQGSPAESGSGGGREGMSGGGSPTKQGGGKSG